jgi:RNA polymerase sigma-70 factor (ECF subfamily)
MTEPIEDHVVQSLLKRCASHDETALKELHRLMAPRIYAFVFHRLRSEGDARDIVVDTLYEAWKCADKFRGESQVSTWLLGIAKYKMMAHWRKASAAPDHDDIEDHAETLPSDLEDGEQALSRWQEELRVKMCMSELSPAHRECLQLVYLEGMDLSEVAAVQQVPKGTVQSRLFHARKGMRLCMQRDEGEPS